MSDEDEFPIPSAASSNGAIINDNGEDGGFVL
jgi:hypothetical protein